MTTLGDLVSLQRGHDLPEQERRAGTVPVIGSAGLTGFHDTPKAKGPGVTLGRSGASFGHVTFVKEDFWPHNATLYVTDFKGNDVRYIAYLLESIDFSSLNSGSAQQSLNRNYLYGIPVAHHPSATQRRIARILSAYDDLIENCERRIKVLDEMARALYREWFVEFRYSGTNERRNAQSMRDNVPKGWRIERLDSVVRVNAEQISTRSAPARIRYIDISSVSPDRIDQATPMAFSEAPGRARRVVRHGDVLWSCVRPNRRSHALVMNPELNTLASTGFAVLTAEKIPFSYLYLATTTDEFVKYLEQRATGAAYPAVTAAVFEAAPLLIPEASLLERFARASVPIFEMKESLRRRVDNLRATRDLLLPRLLSGQLAVSEAA